MHYPMIIMLALLGVFDSLYITLSKYNCEACDTVHNSVWGQPFGVPVAAIGLFGYIFIYLAGKYKKEKIGLALATVGLSVSIPLVFAQAFILKQFCIYCCLSAGIMTVIWLLSWKQAGGGTVARAVSPLVILVIAAVFPIFVIPHYIQAEKGPATIPAAAATDVITVYDSEQQPIVLDTSEQDILYFSSHCGSCEKELAKLLLLPQEERPLMIDAFIPGDMDFETERSAVAEKMKKFNIDPSQVLYDLDGCAPIQKIPIRINHGIRTKD